MIKLSIILISSILTGCSHTKETFNCKYQKGVGCHSISEVNTMLNNGKLSLAPKSKTRSAPFSSINSNVKRIAEEHVTIWVAPHQDHDNWHEECKVHTILRSGFWQ